MDWQGQNLSEQIMQYLLLGSALAAFLTGYITSSYRSMLIMYLIGAGITFLFTVPDWSFFNRHPLEWSEPPYMDVPSTRQLRKMRQLQLKQQQQEEAAKKSAEAYAKQ